MNNYNIDDLILRKIYHMHIELYNKNNNKLEDLCMDDIPLVLRRFDFIDL